MAVRCSWLHCGASFEGHPSLARLSGWGLVCRHTSTGEQVVVCPDHLQELLDADLRALLRLFAVPGLPRLSSDDGPVEETRRLGPPSSRGKVGG